MSTQGKTHQLKRQGQQLTPVHQLLAMIQGNDQNDHTSVATNYTCSGSQHTTCTLIDSHKPVHNYYHSEERVQEQKL